jgi:hypothetical protein
MQGGTSIGRARAIAAAALVALLGAVVAGCEGGAEAEGPVAKAPPESRQAAVASCREAALGTPPKHWYPGNEAKAGRFSLQGPGIDLRGPQIVRLEDGWRLAKAPAIVSGARRVVVSVPSRFTRRMGLSFNKLQTPSSLSGAYRRITFLPCEDRRRTGWPGGFVFHGTKPIELEVRTPGEERTLTLRLGRR